MSFISYAQNYEDVMLARALRGVDKGFYIDVGAQDPVEYSVTKAFYERGWRGINVEPVTHWHGRLMADRPRDTNLKLAASAAPGSLRFFEIVDTGLSTINQEFAKRHERDGYCVHEVEIECATLDEICTRQCVNTVHFLKVDCEGAEADVLGGCSFIHVRPWIVLVEATEPLSQTESYGKWESLITGRGYHYVYADGLNRYYVADEHDELDQAFSYPPNVFDAFIRVSEFVAREQLAALSGEVPVLRSRVEFLDSENERREAALVEHRSMFAESAQREARREASLAEYQRELYESAQREALREASLADYQRQLDEATRRQSQMRGEALSLSNEIGRLHHEVASRDRDIAQLHVLIHAIHHSTSWRVTRPLRLLRRGMQMMSRALLRAIYLILRWPMRLVRPLLRRLAGWAWLRSLARRVAGTDSRLARHAGLFLFGSNQVEQVLEAPEEPEEPPGDVPMTRQAKRVLEEIRVARVHLQRDDTHTRREGE